MSDKIIVGDIKNSVGISIGGNVSGSVILAGNNINVTDHKEPIEIIPCGYCRLKVETGKECPRCLGVTYADGSINW